MTLTLVFFIYTVWGDSTPRRKALVTWRQSGIHCLCNAWRGGDSTPRRKAGAAGDSYDLRYYRDGTTPLGVAGGGGPGPRVARGTAQPWALGHNAVVVGGGMRVMVGLSADGADEGGGENIPRRGAGDGGVAAPKSPTRMERAAPAASNHFSASSGPQGFAGHSHSRNWSRMPSGKASWRPSAGNMEFRPGTWPLGGSHAATALGMQSLCRVFASSTIPMGAFAS